MAGEIRILLDDRLLIEELLVGLSAAEDASLYTTSYWYYRACRAAVLGAGGQLSGPFHQLRRSEQERAIAGLLDVRADIGLPDARSTVPVMAEVARRQPRLNLLNLEAVGAAVMLGATVWLSPQAAEGVLPAALANEDVLWDVVRVE